MRKLIATMLLVIVYAPEVWTQECTSKLVVQVASVDKKLENVRAAVIDKMSRKQNEGCYIHWDGDSSNMIEDYYQKEIARCKKRGEENCKVPYIINEGDAVLSLESPNAGERILNYGIKNYNKKALQFSIRMGETTKDVEKTGDLVVENLFFNKERRMRCMFGCCYNNPMGKILAQAGTGLLLASTGVLATLWAEASIRDTVGLSEDQTRNLDKTKFRRGFLAAVGLSLSYGVLSLNYHYSAERVPIDFGLQWRLTTFSTVVKF